MAADNNTAVTLFSGTLDAPITIVLKEKYGTAVTLDKVNSVIDRDGSLWITRNGTFWGQYSKDNFSVHLQEVRP